MRQTLVAGNWKMNGSREENRHLLDGIKAGLSEGVGAEVVVCPPAIYIPQVARRLNGSGITWGGQDLSLHESGAYTGEISAAMLWDYQCRYVIIGHSERRSLHGETDAQVAEKFLVAQKVGLTPILCIGELLEEREAGETEAVVARQLDAVIDASGIQAIAGSVIAYEPVWAIGTGKTASPQQAQDVHAFIRQRVATQNTDVAEKVQILYGGSVKPDNAAELFAMADIDGGLIGGASLDAEGFLAICRAV
ncbi:MAG: triose-phosphate isomerase [Gammaproteobacteria bacterium]|nr:triose-phosphate isomerase [Gammaproteobacteria bacterium]MCF6364442.1 triose-phosphate isomerase [Gammaproteobacteria bacterium]